MKFLILLSFIFSLTTINWAIGNDVIKCPPAEVVNPPSSQAIAVEIRPAPAVQTELAEEKEIEEKAAVALEAELLPSKNLTATEKLKIYRTKLEERNTVLLQKKLEMIRLQQEMALLRNLENSMNQTIRNLENL